MPAQWKEVKEIFHGALELAPEARTRFLEERCDGDADLRGEVESLLFSSGGDSFLETPAVAGLLENVPRTLPNGSLLGHYEIEAQIGSGGMGTVYLASDTKLGRKVAIKVLNERFSREGSDLERFIREAKAASALNHPNILVIHEIGEADGVYYIVSEFIEGKTLREAMRERQLPLAEVVDIVTQVAGALSAAHEAHLIHRDVKPENIMVRRDGYAKLLDFGLAKLVDGVVPALHIEPTAIVDSLRSTDNTSTVTAGETAHGVILGTVNYMSPEQATGVGVDERTDIFSLGVLIFELLTGQAPFAGNTTSETVFNLINTEAVPPSSLDPSILPELDRLVLRALNKDRDQRYSSMRDLFADLKALAAGPTVRRGTFNDEAYWLNVQGRCLVATHFPADARNGIEYFEGAIALDPRFAAPYAGIAQACVNLSHSGGGAQSDLMERAKASARKAIELDPFNAEAHATVGEIEYLYEWDFNKAGESLSNAIRLDPQSELAHSIYGQYLASVGRFDEAIPEIRTAYELDPKSCANQVIFGRILYLARRFDDANVQFKRVVEIFPQWSTAYSWIWLIYDLKGDHKNAFEWLIKNQEQVNAPPDRISAYQAAYSEGGWRGVAEKLLEFESPQGPGANYYAAARHCIRLNDADRAIEYLKRSFEGRQYQMTWLNVDPYFDPLRGDSRFVEIIRSLGFD